MGDSLLDYPLSSRFEEMDTLVIFDHVFIPRDRIFLYGDANIAQQFSQESQFRTHVSHSTLCRYIAKTQFFLGLVEYMQHLDGSCSNTMNEQVTEIITIMEILKSLLISSEVNASPDRWGNMVPNKNTMLVANLYFPKVYPRMTEIVQTLGSNRLIMIPSERDLHSDSGSYLDKYLTLNATNAADAIRLHRLAWEASTSSFSGRQIQYERFFFGSPGTLIDRLYSGYSNREQYMDDIIQFLRMSGARISRTENNYDSQVKS